MAMQQGGGATAKRKPMFTKVDQLKPGTSGHTLIAKVVDSKTILNKGRPTVAAAGNLRPTRIAECLIGDETGAIIFTARNEQGLKRGANSNCTCGFKEQDASTCPLLHPICIKLAAVLMICTSPPVDAFTCLKSFEKSFFVMMLR